jgi:hypothetical protein
MITELTDTLDQLDQCRRRVGHVVGDNVCVSPSLVAKAAFRVTRDIIKDHAVSRIK